MVSAKGFLTWTLAILAHVLLIAFIPGFAALVPVAVLGVMWEVRHQMIRRQMRAELRQIVND